MGRSAVGAALVGMLASAVMALAAGSAQASFLVQESQRVVAVQGRPYECIDTPDGPYCDQFDRNASESTVGSGPWSATAALDSAPSVYATQLSLISESELSATGTVSANIVPDDSANTGYDVIFASAVSTAGFDLVMTPEPSTGLLAASGIACLGLWRRRRSAGQR